MILNLVDQIPDTLKDIYTYDDSFFTIVSFSTELLSIVCK